MTHSLASTAAKEQPSMALPSQLQRIAAPSPSSTGSVLESKVHSLAAIWARKYVISVTSKETTEHLKTSDNLATINSKEGRTQTASKLIKHLTLASAQAWSTTEMLLSEEMERHDIDPSLIDPWQIAADSHNLFKKSLDAYAERITPRRLSVVVGNDFGRVRRKYTAQDPRAIGFVSMQFHYTGKMLLEKLPSTERSLLEPYFKVMDDHMYMPLRDAYKAAAEHDLGSPVLAAVQALLPVSTKIAHAVCTQVGRSNPGYESYSGLLNSSPVRVSSIRDVEMFQVYLCLCILEDSIRSVQQELFPLCVMLYPRLNVSWKLVQDMLQTLGWEMHDRLAPDHLALFLPYLRTLSEMFSVEVFQN
ncbi:MAG TPA: hypothetical protein V6D16_14255 [Candidatus Obscuribacterales bacterium]